jgi:membrane protein DedA with SNARE-associated domain
VRRSTLWATIAGTVLIGIGLLIMAAALKGSGSQEPRIAGLLLMAFGAMVISVPMYIDGRRLQAEYLKKSTRSGKARGASRCSSCGLENASLWCTTHTVRLCSDCVPKHDDGTRCLYKSLTRAPARQKSASTA